jgi:hypothetical protein
MRQGPFEVFAQKNDAILFPQKSHSAAVLKTGLGGTKDKSRRPARRLLEHSREDSMVAWIRMVVRVKRGCPILTYFEGRANRIC